MPLRPPKTCRNPTCKNLTQLKYCEKCRKQNTKAFVIVGPPGSGKTTYVESKRRRHDLTLDYDGLYRVLSGCELYDKPENLLGLVLDTGDFIIDQIGYTTEIPTAWLITTNRTHARHLSKILGATIIEMQVDPEECKRRIRLDPTRPAHLHAQMEAQVDAY